jgi:hypothetical protein
MRPAGVDEDRGVVAPEGPVVLGELGIAQAEGQAEAPGPRRTAVGVSRPGISGSKKASSSALSVMAQRGKNVVSASSGKTTRSQSRLRASRRRTISRMTTAARLSSARDGSELGGADRDGSH